MCAINYESLVLFGKFGGAMLGLLLLVWLIALLTPKAAALIDRLAGKPRPERQAEPAPLSPPSSDVNDTKHTEPPQGGSEKNINSESYKVYSIFEDRPTDDKK